MLEHSVHPASSSSPFPDRRKANRVSLKSVAYVELEPGNGGLILNLSEDGIAVQSAVPIIGADFPHLRFCFPNSTKWIEVDGKLVWEDASRKEAGIQFIRIRADARAQIRNYLSDAKASLEVSGDAGSPNVAEQNSHSLELRQEVGLSEELDSMFPSEKEVAPSRGPVVHRGADFFPSEAAVGKLESDIASEEGRPNQSELHRYRAPVRPCPAVGVDQAGISSSRRQFDSESTSDEYDPAMPVPNFRHLPPNSSPNPSIDPNIVDHKIDPNEDRAAYDRLVAAFAAAANSPSAHSAAPPQAHLSNESAPRPSGHPPIAFSGFGYQPSEFEEPFGKKWIGVAAVLLAIFATGVVLAVGPANVKDLIFRHHAIFESLAGPPPPTLPGKQSDKSGAALDATANEQPTQPAASSSASPATLPPDTLDVRGSQSGSPSSADAGPLGNSPALPSAEDSNGQYGGADSADPEAEVLQFQREHSEARSTDAGSYRTPTEASVPHPKPDVTPSPAPPAASIADSSGNSAPFRSASEANRASSERQRSTPQTQPPDGGVVAIRSSFNAVQGINAEPSETSDSSPTEGPVVPGPLKTVRQPDYPVEALRAHVEGTVTLRATVDRTGAVQAVKLIGGPPILAPAAIEAVRQWHYAPTTLSGQAVESTEDIDVVFRMANSVAAPH